MFITKVNNNVLGTGTFLAKFPGTNKETFWFMKNLLTPEDNSVKLQSTDDSANITIDLMNGFADLVGAKGTKSGFYLDMFDLNEVRKHSCTADGKGSKYHG